MTAFLWKHIETVNQFQKNWVIIKNYLSQPDFKREIVTKQSEY